MPYSESLPHLQLQTLIDAYWICMEERPSEITNKILPDGCVDLIINMGSDVMINTGVTLKHEKVYLTGPMTAPIKTVRTKDSFSIGIRFKPSAFTSFFSLGSLHQYHNQIIEFEKANCFDLKKVLTNPTACLDDFMFRQLKSKKYDLSPIINEVQKTGGRLNIQALASRNHMTVRQMERKFREEVGFSPKSLAKLYRLRNALEEMKRGGSLAEIAFKCGYYDQAHLCNEVKKYTGSVPSLL